MAPASALDLGLSNFPNHHAAKSIFPDGIRTSGQHAPLFEKLRPYSKFPKEITGPTMWKKEDYINNPERWTHPFTNEEVVELGAAAENFIEKGIPLTGITKVCSFYHRTSGQRVVMAIIRLS
jgi:hypothetical protein